MPKMRSSPAAIWAATSLADVDLFGWILAAVAVAEVDHDARGNRRLRPDLRRGVDVGRVVVRLFAAAQDHMAIFVPGSRHDGGMAVFGHRQKMMRRLSGADRVESDSDVAVGAVLETDRARQTGRELAVHLTLGGARADGAPGNEIGQILRRNHIEKFAARRHAAFVEVEQKVAGDAQTVVDVKTAVKIGVVDQPFPSHGGARLLKIDAHDDQQIRGVTFFGFFQFAGVFFARL